MTRIETTKELLYHLGNRVGGSGREGPTGTVQVQAVEALGRRIAEAAAHGPVEVVAK